jgi:serine/threonine protein kinase
MKRTCLRCERSSPANTLFCHDVHCPAERSPAIFEAADRIGDIEIVRPITSLRSATVYEALQQGQPVCMKIAHPGVDHRDRLMREALFLRTLVGEKKQRYPTLPTLLPPYVTTTVEDDAFGTTMFGRELLHYYLFEVVDGQALDELLIQQPQWWVNHVGWLSIELAMTINTLHLKGLYHFGLSPASVLVRFDQNPFAPHIVLCDLGIASNTTDLSVDWYPDFVEPTYLAPELVSTADGSQVGVHTDVYGLGLVLYEMLVGEPVFATAIATDTQAIEAVRRDARTRMSRVEDVSPVAEIASRAASASVSQRPATAADLVEELVPLVGEAPVRKKSDKGVPLSLLFVIGGAALVMVFLVALAVSLSVVPVQ